MIRNRRLTAVLLRFLGIASRSLLALILVAGASALFGARVDAGDDTVYVRYSLDRQVPEWVTFREVTLRINVGPAETVRVWADGSQVPVRYDRQQGLAWVTTASSELVLAAQGPGVTPSNVGAWRLTTLKDDKLWAYSLTFDDGALSVLDLALPELERYGYRAGVAVIGQWLDREDAHYYNYCDRDDLLSLLDSGWSIFNHSYSHFDSPGDITYEDAWRAQEAIRTKLNGYRATVFTVPYTNHLWRPIIDANSEALGLYLMQLFSDSGARLTLVDAPVTVGSGSYHLTRDGINDWIEGQYNYFDAAHGAAIDSSPAHAWVSLHGHSVRYDLDWCAVADSTSYLYHKYGAGGTDEVWVAPADEVYQYLVVRSYTQVTRSEATSRPLGSEARAPQLVQYRQGVSGDATWDDTYIYELYPGYSFSDEQRMFLRAGDGIRSSLLIKVDLMPPSPDAVVRRAILSLYASSQSNSSSLDLKLYPVSRPWRGAEASWIEASASTPWQVPGALAPGPDRLGISLDETHVGDCPKSVRSYAFDVGELVTYWLEYPEHNHGLVVDTSGEVAKAISFVSSEHPDLLLRPVLSVEYGWPMAGPSPTPTATPTQTITPTPTRTPTVTPSPTATVYSASLALPLVLR